MAHSTTFTCDRCGETAVDNQQFLMQIRVQIESPYALRNGGFANSNAPTAAWCKKCLVRFGLIDVDKTNLPAPDAPEVPPSLEEILREIVRDEIEANR
jgi:hypothetical protein